MSPEQLTSLIRPIWGPLSDMRWQGALAMVRRCRQTRSLELNMHNAEARTCSDGDAHPSRPSPNLVRMTFACKLLGRAMIVLRARGRGQRKDRPVRPNACTDPTALCTDDRRCRARALDKTNGACQARVAKHRLQALPSYGGRTQSCGRTQGASRCCRSWLQKGSGKTGMM